MKSIILVAVAILMAGCGTSSSVPAGNGAKRSSKHISASEIEQLVQASTAYDIVAHSRPMWLMSRRYIGETTKALVYLDGQRIGPVEMLYDLDADFISSMTLVSAVDASLQHGPVHPDGAIFITSQSYQAMLDSQAGIAGNRK